MSATSDHHFYTKLVLRSDPKVQSAVGRSAIYCLLAIVFFFLLECWGLLQIPLFTYLFLLFMSLGFVYPWYLLKTYAILMDDTGITERFRSKTESWSWEDIRSDRVEWDWERDSLCEISTAKKRKHISFGAIPFAEAEKVRQFLLPQVRTQSPPLPAEELKLRLCLTSMLLTKNELTLHPEDVKRRTTYVWKDISAITTHFRHGLIGFIRLELKLPDRKRPLILSMRTNRTWGQSWQGPSAPELMEFIRHSVPCDRILQVSVREVPRTLEEYYHRKAVLVKEYRQTRLGFIIYLIVLLSAYVGTIIDVCMDGFHPGNVGWLFWFWLGIFSFLILLVGLPIICITIANKREFLKSTSELEEQWRERRMSLADKFPASA